jgi:hypothetical protein
MGCERGVKDFWSENRSWQMLTTYSESEKSFWLKFETTSFPIFKSDFNNVEDIGQLREFLKNKIDH